MTFVGLLGNMSRMTDQDLIEERRWADKRKFMIRALNSDHAPILGPAVRALRDLLSDGAWHGHVTVMATMLRASDITVKTADGQLRIAWGSKLIERRGSYVRKYDRQARGWRVTDTREYRLIEWPES